MAFTLPYWGVSSPLKYSPPGAFSLATFALDDSARLWPNARRDRNRFSWLPNNSRHRPAIRSTRTINSLMRIALTHRYRRTPHANIVTTRVRGMMRASVRPPECDLSCTIRSDRLPLHTARKGRLITLPSTRIPSESRFSDMVRESVAIIGKRRRICDLYAALSARWNCRKSLYRMA